jgi:hypothetical protein
MDPWEITGGSTVNMFLTVILVRYAVNLEDLVDRAFRLDLLKLQFLH